ncbi:MULTISPECIES: cbb3-type cytochrome c oxidase subunit 3 [Massilia]|uniref:Cbb3-type cytochrome c oxidase subunit 3 n=1 Tax=Massilia rubra TaxID=2607910 RepID=A0ABX0M002_9BURK|nr:MULTISPECIES: cbb3-type cytochrome c oxidase subunit 3 [Massilia]NHZ37492.1 cbb3-type cytochrome c oxidase subunit 3 [Massilia rubra]NHZ97524.1 CcoQ/FixQ family Cbb3-type cytochrome c oxidase assembly chaperone [Massilia sp. CCM 8734]
MAIEHIFDSASSVMTVISFATFCGILLWTFVLKGNKDFETQAALPFADDNEDNTGESGHG